MYKRQDVSFDGKAEAIAKILNETGFDRCMVFCNTKGNTERITKFLQMRGIDAECIHGDIPQRRREQVMDLSLIHISPCGTAPYPSSGRPAD